MATIKDIAREAGVSCGTVSNVLNRKGNVKAEKIKRVEEAVRLLGYEVNESAKTLRKQIKRTVALLVPNMRSRHYIEVYEVLCSNLRVFDYDVEIYSTDNLYEREKGHIRKMISANVTGIVSFPTYIESGDLYNKIPESIYLTLVGPRPSGITRPYLHVSVDYEHIANSIASHVLEEHCKNAAIFIDSVRFSDTFKYIITQRLTKAGAKVSCFDSTSRTAIVRAFEILEKGIPFDVIVTSNTQRARAVRQAYASFLPGKMPEIITLSASNTIFEDEYTCVFLNYHKLGNLVSDILVDAMVKHKEMNTSFILNSAGIHKKQLNLPRFQPRRTLSILAAEDPCTGVLPTVLPQFEQRTGLKAEVSFYPRSMQRQAVTEQAVQGFDLLIADLSILELGPAGLFLSRAENPGLWDRLRAAVDPAQTYFPGVGKEALCLSFNTACQMLFYRKDWMREQSVKRRYYERFYRELEAPGTLADFDSIAQFFSQDYHAAPQQLYGASMSSFHAGGFWMEFFGRLQAAGLSFLDERGALSLCQEPLIAEILRYFQLLQVSNVKNSKHACSGIDEFVRGASVMSIFSTASAYRFNDNQYGPIVDCAACHDVPGGRPVVDGNVIGILAGARRTEESLAFLQWVFHDSICNILTLLSGQPICRASTQNTEILELYPWLKYFNRNVQEGYRVTERFSRRAADPAFLGALLTALTNAYINPDQLKPGLCRLEETWRRPGGEVVR